jgi:exopolysaccharide production protein ExoQ
MTSVALLLCLGCIFTILWLNRDRSSAPVPALWLPTIWIAIVGSRPLSYWLSGGGAGGAALDSTLEGSSTDAMFLGLLVAVGLVVLANRGKEAREALRSNPAVVIYFAYCLLSVCWSPFPDAALKRWVRALGDLVMVLVIVTDERPFVAFTRVFSRAGVVLMSFSIFLIRYSPLGRGFDPDGRPMNTGVTTNKNTLGVVAFVIGLSAVAAFLVNLRDKQPGRSRRLLSHGALVALAVAVLVTAHSATALACFIAGTSLMLALRLGGLRSNANAVHALMIAISLLTGAVIVLGGQSILFEALGRDSNLTGRTDIWSTVIPLAINPIWGSGFESFWNAVNERLRDLPDGYMFGNLNSAHNGYIDVYLNLGLIGLSLVVWIVLSSYGRACAAFRRDAEFGALGLAYTLTIALYCITEAGFRVMSPTWICLLFSIMGASRVAAAPGRTEAVRNGVPATPRPQLQNAWSPFPTARSSNPTRPRAQWDSRTSK